MKKLYKVLDDQGRSCNGGDASWSLPLKGADGKWNPGEWMPKIKGKLELCENGYHLCRSDDLLSWLGKQIFEAEYRGEKREGGNKIVVRQCRLLRKCEGWTEKSARLFACWSVRHTPLADGRKVWDLLNDKKGRTAVEVAEEYAKGKATKKELATARAAAAYAVWGATGDAVGDAAWYAAKAVTGEAAKDAAWYAAWEAAKDAAKAVTGEAAKDAAWYAAWTAARVAQTKELIKVLDGGKKEEEKEKI
ncbi:MAG: hypothetical protein U9N01_04330 [Euryarchaeota archaeon]|nr:hypothetical protein [Euryarchaeota archaeon]